MNTCGKMPVRLLSGLLKCLCLVLGCPENNLDGPGSTMSRGAIMPLLLLDPGNAFFKNIIPDLKKAGITDEQINTVILNNPKKMFEG
ncbi:MAG: phosphotriesterase family protein [Syntrophales bacterium]